MLWVAREQALTPYIYLYSWWFNFGILARTGLCGRRCSKRYYWIKAHKAINPQGALGRAVCDYKRPYNYFIVLLYIRMTTDHAWLHKAMECIQGHNRYSKSFNTGKIIPRRRQINTQKMSQVDTSMMVKFIALRACQVDDRSVSWDYSMTVGHC